MTASQEIIGARYTPVRAVTDRGAAIVEVPKLCFASVLAYHGLAGLYIGSMAEAWSAAADLSSQVHIVRVDETYRQVLFVSG